VIGPQIKASLGSIPGSGLPLVIGALLLLFGASRAGRRSCTAPSASCSAS
jgi:hypothetical protein